MLFTRAEDHAVRRAGMLPVALGLTLLLLAGPGAAADDPRLTLVGQYVYPSKAEYDGTTVGGLSGIAYDPERDVYYAVSDDRGELQPGRFYTLQIDLGSGGIGDVRVIGVTTLDSDADAPGIQPYGRNELDAEEIVLTAERELIISSERDQQGRPWIRRFALDGTLLGELPIPERFRPESQPGPDGRPEQVRGVRNNHAFEGLALTPDGATLYAANEQALAQDGPDASLEAGTTVRVLRYDRAEAGWQPDREVAYLTEPISTPPIPADAPADNGLVALLWAGHLWPDLDLLAMERGYSPGVGNEVRIFGVALGDAERTDGLAALPSPFGGVIAGKLPLVRMSDLGVAPDNLEGMTYGPRLANGKPSLIVLSDDNFSAAGSAQINQFLLFELNDTAADEPGG